MRGKNFNFAVNFAMNFAIAIFHILARSRRGFKREKFMPDALGGTLCQRSATNFAPARHVSRVTRAAYGHVTRERGHEIGQKRQEGRERGMQTAGEREEGIR